MRVLTQLKKRIHYRLIKRLYRPSISIAKGQQLVFLGSKYGGWTVQEEPYLEECIVVSCGLGEDASFDVEFAARYHANIIIVDPTPRAIAHFESLSRRLGQSAECIYSNGGNQPTNAYSLESVSEGQLQLVPKALWIEDGSIEFYAPEDSSHVSYSIKFKSSKHEAARIAVPATTIESVLADIDYARFALLKMDIEGAEVDILSEIDKWPALPKQILVEFDVLRMPGAQSKTEVQRVDGLLRSKGYLCRHFDGNRNYLYVR